MKIWKKFFDSGKDFDVVNARFVKPLDTELLFSLKNKNIVTIEDNVFIGGLGSLIDSALCREYGETGAFKVKNFAYRDEFIPQGSIADLQREYGVACDEIERYLAEILK